MEREALDAAIAREIAGADARVSLLAQDMDTGEVLYATHADDVVSAASTIKVPILVTVLGEVAAGRLLLDTALEVKAGEILDDSEVFEYGPCRMKLWELLYWMIVSSDNTATNVLLETLGYERINGVAADLGMARTRVARKMLDAEGRVNGRDNVTTAADMARCFEALHRGRILTPPLRRFAYNTLRRQRSQEKFLRYIADDVAVAHKTGGLDPIHGHDLVSHDAGVFIGVRRYYLGVFMTEAPDDPAYSARFIGRIAKMLYEAYGRN